MSKQNKNINSSPSPTPSASSSTSETAETLVSDILDRTRGNINKVLMSLTRWRAEEQDSALPDVNSSPSPTSSASSSTSEIETMVTDILERARGNIDELMMSVSRWRAEAQDSDSPESYVTERVSRHLHRFFALRRVFAETRPSALTITPEALEDNLSLQLKTRKEEDQEDLKMSQHNKNVNGSPSPTPSASSSTSETAETLVSDILDRVKGNINEPMMSVSQREAEEQDSASPDSSLTPEANITVKQKPSGKRIFQKLKKTWKRHTRWGKKQAHEQHLEKEDEKESRISESPTSEERSSELSFAGMEEEDDRSPVKKRLVDSDNKLEDSLKDTPITSTPGTPQLVELSKVSLASAGEDLVEKEIPGEDARGTEEEDDLSPVNMRLVDSENKLEDSLKDTPITSAPGTPQLVELSKVSSAIEEEDFVEYLVELSEVSSVRAEEDLVEEDAEDGPSSISGLTQEQLNLMIARQQITGIFVEGLRQMTEIIAINNVTGLDRLHEKEIIAVDHESKDDRLTNANVKFQKKKMPWWRYILKKHKVHPIATLEKDEVSQPLPEIEETQREKRSFCTRLKDAICRVTCCYYKDVLV